MMFGSSCPSRLRLREIEGVDDRELRVLSVVGTRGGRVGGACMLLNVVLAPFSDALAVCSSHQVPDPNFAAMLDREVVTTFASSWMRSTKRRGTTSAA